MKEIVGRDYLLTQVLKDCVLKYSFDEIEEISDIFMEKLYECFKEGKSLVYNEGSPIFKSRISVANHQDNSPKTPRNDRVLVTLKIELETKLNKEG